ncbi:hypothetical protein EHQ64_07275 [Leptospira sarikeiensis]|uniref:Uncharacterized protein n=1 Tax=Leptospira sarikeiensis TaxID=2484943 RepID=A0A4R9K8Q9_9LEPT|nr:hypothetical protein EHQ64_07275 [Leptospira sarikeiensis]
MKMTPDALEDILKSGTISFLMKKHINDCSDCQSIVLDYSSHYTIPESVFKRPIEKQRLLWLGAELENADKEEVPEKVTKKKKKLSANVEEPIDELGSTPGKFSKFLAFCSRYKKWILAIGYLALIYPIFRLVIAFL